MMQGSAAPIVVGVDGSEEAQRALGFAAEEAGLRSAPLRAVHAWMVPPVAFTAAGYPAWPELLQDLEEAATRLLEQQVQTVLGDGARVEVERVVREGQPTEVLVSEAEASGAQLLVVGSRGLGGFKGLLLGSVSQAVASHAPCPVTIVRATRRRG
jgi:nucleotide-binding universal stress UspA family protein